MARPRKIVALAGQPNSGKSTIFNALTGARQHVANYPGVTVDVKTGYFAMPGEKVAIADLPGTYSLTSYSEEERLARDFILHEKPTLILNVVDASNLKRNLYFTFQLLEMENPVLVDLNMADVAQNRGLRIDTDRLSEYLGTKVISTAANKRKGRGTLKNSLVEALSGTKFPSFRIDYGDLEDVIERLSSKLEMRMPPDLDYPLRWLSLKLLENDSAILDIIKEKFQKYEEILAFVESEQKTFEEKEDQETAPFIAYQRHLLAAEIERTCVVSSKEASSTFTDKVDKVVCNRYMGPVVLAGIIYMLYELSINKGYELTNYVIPYLERFKNIVEGFLPISGFLHEPLIRSVVMSVVMSINAVLIYVPIFLILFGLIAILEDVGYMPRMAFILDRVFRKFGLHGHSTLPLILGGVFVGGCAVPGVMATRVIADEKARLATILIVPLMNCLAKVPLYTLLISIYFAKDAALLMFFISTITIIIALPVAKVLTMTLLKNKESAPFVMELPPYHLPTIRGVVTRAVERTWLFFKKVITIIMLVAVAVFFLTNYPGLDSDREGFYQNRADHVRQAFMHKIEGTKYYDILKDENTLDEYLSLQERYKDARMALGKTSEEKRESFEAGFEAKYNQLYPLLKPEGKEGRALNKAYKKMRKGRAAILREMGDELTQDSFLGRAGRFLEPVTKYAGFNWKINIALLSSLAAKESSVATLGALYKPGEESEGESLSQRMKSQEKGFTPLHALALMIFMALYPPCIATLLMVKVEAGGWKWALLALCYPIVLGLGLSSLVFTGGRLLGFSGIQAMFAFYALAIVVALGMMKFGNNGMEDLG